MKSNFWVIMINALLKWHMYISPELLPKKITFMNEEMSRSNCQTLRNYLVGNVLLRFFKYLYHSMITMKSIYYGILPGAFSISSTWGLKKVPKQEGGKRRKEIGEWKRRSKTPQNWWDFKHLQKSATLWEESDGWSPDFWFSTAFDGNSSRYAYALCGMICGKMVMCNAQTLAFLKKKFRYPLHSNF